jgi:glycosyltransferase involved in cell wall biosynthesis
MKICLLNNLYKPYNRGGAEKVLEAIIAKQQKAGNEIILITTKPQIPALEENNDCKTFYIKSDFYNLNQKSLITKLFWHFGDLVSCKKYQTISKILKAEQPDVVVTHNLMGLGLRVAKIIKKYKIKHHHFLHDIQLLHPSGLMISGHEKKIDSIFAKIYQAITSSLIGSPALIISPSNWLLKEHLKRGFFKTSKQEIKRLEDVLPLNSPKTISLNKNNKNLLFIGQIEKHKGILFLITAFKKYAQPNTKLNIAGDGSQLEEAKLLASSDNRINILGRLGKAELEKLMSESNILIMPSLCYENYPMVIVEAKNASLSVIASNIGGVPEMTDSRDLLFAPGDAKDLFKQINKV